MKDSGVEWIGEIPDKWNITRNKQIFSESTERDNTGKLDLLSVSEYYGVGLKKEKIGDSDFLTHAESLDGYKICKKDDLVINIMLAWKRAIGVSQYEGVVSPAYCVFTPDKSEIEAKYYHYLFRTDICADYFKQYSTGIIDSRLRLYPNIFLSLYSLKPPRNLQTAIVNYLDSISESIDFIIEEEEIVVEKLKEYRQSIITEAVTKGLHNIPMKDSGVEWIGKIPENWLSVQFRRAVRLKQGLQIAQSDRFSENGENRFVYITLKYINSKKQPEDTEYIENPDENVMCTVDDILFVRTGATGQIATNVYGVFHNNFFKILYNKQLLSKQYLVYYLSQKTLQEHFALLAGTTTIPDLNHDDFLSSYILIPPYSEQNEIVDYLDKKCAAIDKLIAEKEQVINKLEEYKKSLIYECVTGKRECGEIA